MLLDSNIIIYSSKPQYDFLLDFIAENSPSVSIISFVEVMGFHRLTEAEKTYLENFFAEAELLALDETIAQKAVQLRQIRKLGLGDALLVATCLVHNLPLVTRNTKDFSWIPDLDLLDPFPPESA